MGTRIKDILDFINKFVHKDRSINPTTIPPDNFAEGLTDIGGTPGRLTYSAPDHPRRGIGVEIGLAAPKMTFLKTTGDTDELFKGIYAFCNCKNTGSPSDPCIRLTSIADQQDDEHIITTDVTITSAGILYSAEITDDEWFRAFQRGLGIPLITPDQPAAEAVEDWFGQIDAEHQLQLVERASEMVYGMGRRFPSSPGTPRRHPPPPSQDDEEQIYEDAQYEQPRASAARAAAAETPQQPSYYLHGEGLEIELTPSEQQSAGLNQQCPQTAHKYQLTNATWNDLRILKRQESLGQNLQATPQAVRDALFDH